MGVRGVREPAFSSSASNKACLVLGCRFSMPRKQIQLHLCVIARSFSVSSRKVAAKGEEADFSLNRLAPRSEDKQKRPPLPGPVASQAHHQMGAPTRETASQNVVLPRRRGSQGWLVSGSCSVEKETHAESRRR